jgi:hypothetical protein
MMGNSSVDSTATFGPVMLDVVGKTLGPDDIRRLQRNCWH